MLLVCTCGYGGCGGAYVEEEEENEEEVGEQKVCMYVSHLRRDLIF